MTTLGNIIGRATLVAAAFGIMPAGWSPPTESPAPQATVLLPFAASDALPRGYGLPIVEVPVVPPSLLQPLDAAASPVGRERGCPVEVRAIVVSDDAASSFAVIAAGGRSSLLHSGDGVRIGNSFVAVTLISPDHLNLRRGSTTYRCDLSNAAR